MLDDIDKLKLKRICDDCVGEPFLKDLIQKTGKKRKCAYCKISAPTISVGELAERVDGAFDRHYRRTSTEPDGYQWMAMKDPESNYDWERDGEPVIWAIVNAAVISEKAATDVQEILSEEHGSSPSDYTGEEEPYDSDSHYEEISVDDYAWQEEWRNFEHSLKTESRYFSQTGLAHLKSVFAGLDALKTSNGQALIVDAGPGTPFEAFYRARYFESGSKLKEAMKRPDRNIGPPPTELAAAGRMNARGISVFYGAGNAETARAEIRPPVGSRVIVAKFKVMRTLKLLDLRSFLHVHEAGSIFDETLARRTGRAVFLRSLVFKMTMPVMPSDEATSYLPTQAIADFLASNMEPELDGILFPSVQVAGAGLNVVLFHKASRVAGISLPKDTKLIASQGHTTEEGYEADYTVFEEVPKRDEPEEQKAQTLWEPIGIISPEYAYGGDTRMTSLDVDLGSVEVHEIKSVSFVADVEAVTRHRIERRFQKVTKQVDEEIIDF
ncbi:RES domain-containing protein [Enhydrobacter aerosaccus]|uniref:RES domain-containing protein n=1 Tax=Enhydrobacter aerosaccus TaxID=225324 RepID=A0A1T4SYE4_9HYPH|nr:RES family NAD+ phosphorylase [Enhydrobacter aerosaccus]SKA33260.1 RES domain-containing protein [Enhydrobacter aerosaccus]